jgi:phenylalanyl-tRNA synthetase alpha chain
MSIISETPYADLPAAARERMGIREGQKNVLLRLVVRSHDRTLTAGDANKLRDHVYAALHAGTAYEWARE